MEDISAKQAGRCCHYCGEAYAKPYRIASKLTQTVKILLSEFLRNGYCKACAYTHAEAENKEVHRACRAYSCECVYTEELSDNYCIDHIVKLLKEKP